MAGVYQINDYDFVVKRKRVILDHEILIKFALYHPEQQPLKTMLTLAGCSFINVDYETHIRATVAKGFLVLLL